MERRLVAETSPAALTPLARHEDALSPSTALRESVSTTGSQRIGNSTAVESPVTSFPETDDEV